MADLSIVTTVNNAISGEFYLKELIESVLPIANEIIVVNGDYRDNAYDNQGWRINSEVEQLLKCYFIEYINNNLLKIYDNPWEGRMQKNMWWLQKSIAISHASCDYILRLDADEVLHEDDLPKIKQAIELGYNSYTFKVLHFFRDFDHIKTGINEDDNGKPWYNRKIYLFKNNLGYYDNDKDIVDFKGNNLEPKHTSIKVFHYGHVRKLDTYLLKKNAIEKAHHPTDWIDLTLDAFKWKMEGTELFNGNHPKVMSERMKKFYE